MPLPVMPSTNIADYELGEVLGLGTVGTVYCCTERSTGDSYALKRLHQSVSNDPLIRARFKREMSVMQRMQHPHIVVCYGGGECEDGTLYYLMELVDGGTVKSLLKSNRSIPWPSVVDLGRQLCSALQCAHNNGVVHRDLKPGNLFLTRDAELKLGDFGIARDLRGADLTSSGMTVGTHGYMAPEQITGKDYVSGKADLYSLGCCLFEMLTGRVPFQAANFAMLFEQHLHATPPRVKSFVPDCPDELDSIVDRLLSKDPDDRPFNARQVQALMIELGEQPSERSPTDNDLGTVSVAVRGHNIIRQQIDAQHHDTASSEVSWMRVIVFGILVAVVVAVASLMAR